MTRTTLAVLLATSLAAPALAGGADGEPKTLRPAVRIPVVTGFKAVLKDGVVNLTWKRYKRDDFYSVAVVKSDKDSDPQWPGATLVMMSRTVDTVETDDGRLSPGTWNYRLVITTRWGDRWVSPVVPVVVSEADLRREPPGASDFE